MPKKSGYGDPSRIAIRKIFGFQRNQRTQFGLYYKKKIPVPFLALKHSDSPSRRTCLINTRASYEDEVEMLVSLLIAELGANKIALFRQDDSYGDAGRAASRRVTATRAQIG